MTKILKYQDALKTHLGGRSDASYRRDVAKGVMPPIIKIEGSAYLYVDELEQAVAEQAAKRDMKMWDTEHPRDENAAA